MMNLRKDLSRSCLAPRPVLPARAGALGVLAMCLSAAPLSGAIVWVTGAAGITTVAFEKEAYADHNLPENQDQISEFVTITREGVDMAGSMFNIEVETGAGGASPAGTEWAFANINGNPGSLSAANFMDYTFANFLTARGGSDPTLVLGNDGVLHLIAEDIYLDIRITDWGIGMDGGGGSFAYTRTSGPVPEPGCAILICLGFGGALVRRRRS